MHWKVPTVIGKQFVVTFHWFTKEIPFKVETNVYPITGYTNSKGTKVRYTQTA